MFDRKEYEGKRALRRWPKWLPVVAALALATAVTVGGTLAWLTAHTDSVTNTFTMGNVDPDVEESFDPDAGTKSEIKVTNNGSVEAYVRVALVFSWRNGAVAGQYNDGEQPGGDIVAGTPMEGQDYEMSENLGEGWVLGSDGYYYYTKPVAPKGGKTETSLCTITVLPGSEKAAEYNLDVQVLADSIQAAPETAVTTMWGIDNDGSVERVGDKGALVIKTSN